jgi:hypothetical protein
VAAEVAHGSCTDMPPTRKLVKPNCDPTNFSNLQLTTAVQTRINTFMWDFGDKHSTFPHTVNQVFIVKPVAAYANGFSATFGCPKLFKISRTI